MIKVEYEQQLSNWFSGKTLLVKHNTPNNNTNVGQIKVLLLARHVYMRSFLLPNLTRIRQ